MTIKSDSDSGILSRQSLLVPQNVHLPLTAVIILFIFFLREKISFHKVSLVWSGLNCPENKYILLGSSFILWANKYRVEGGAKT